MNRNNSRNSVSNNYCFFNLFQHKLSIGNSRLQCSFYVPSIFTAGIFLYFFSFLTYLFYFLHSHRIIAWWALAIATIVFQIFFFSFFCNSDHITHFSLRNHYSFVNFFCNFLFCIVLFFHFHLHLHLSFIYILLHFIYITFFHLHFLKLFH